MRKYFSQRKGNKPSVDLEFIKKIFLSIFNEFNSKGYFQKYLGFECTDGFVEGLAGKDVGAYVMRKVRKTDLWPIDTWIDVFYSEEDLFDMIEFVYDHISAPLENEANYHSWNNCGWHYKVFDDEIARLEYINSINEFLNDYKDGYELSSKGEILSLVKEEFKVLFDSKTPPNTDISIQEKIDIAVNKFRKYGSTLEDRSDAVRQLADCLEFLKSNIKINLSHKDDSDIFNIANNFGIRHHNDKQKNNYNKNVWLSWMFYFYLATIHAVVRFKKENENN